MDQTVLTTAEADPIDSSGGRSRQTIRLQPTRGFGRVFSPTELWRYRDVATQIAARDIKVRYRQTVLGAAWAVLQPVTTMVVFTIVFGRVAGISSGGVPYALFSLTGLVPWTFFASTVLLASDSMVSNSSLVAKIYFPRIFIPAGVMVASLVDFGIALVILLITAVAWGFVPSAAVLSLPLLLLVARQLHWVSAAPALSAVNVRFRDVRYVVPFAIQLWLFATPIAYPSSLINEPWRTLSFINPMAGVVEGFRWAILGTSLDAWSIGISALSALVLLLIGLAYFDRVERGFADYL